MVCEKNTHAMTPVDQCVVDGKNTHPMTLGVAHDMVCENNTHAISLVDPCVVHGKNTHAMTLGGCMCGSWEEHTCNDTGGSMCVL